MANRMIITGWSKEHKQMALNPNVTNPGPTDRESGYAIYTIRNGQVVNMHIDPDEPITLRRCAELLSEGERLTGNIYSSITIREYTGEDMECKLLKTYDYCKSQNRLRIWADGLPIYENWDGQICKDRDALADCLC